MGSEGLCWAELRLSSKWGEWLLCSQRHEGRLFVWVWTLSDRREPNELVCNVILKGDDDQSAYFLVPVFPMIPHKKMYAHNSVLTADFVRQVVLDESWNKGFSKQTVFVYSKKG